MLEVIIILCSGVGVGGAINHDNANVYTDSSFDPDSSPISISGYGDISFVDTNSVTINIPSGVALQITSTGYHSVSNVGSVNIDINSIISTSDIAVQAINQGEGDITFLLNSSGDISSTFYTGVYLKNESAAGNIDIDVAVNASIDGYEEGIFSNNQGVGSTNINIFGCKTSNLI